MKNLADYFGIDGMLHIIVCILIVSICNIFAPLWIAVIAAAFLSLGKEFVWDKWMKKGTFDKKDLLADVIGILIGCL